jgi:hypothetical protein
MVAGQALRIDASKHNKVLRVDYRRCFVQSNKRAFLGPKKTLLGLRREFLGSGVGTDAYTFLTMIVPTW